MPDSFLPPVTVELVGKDDGFTRTLTKGATTVERLGEAVKLTAAQVDEAFAAMLRSAEQLGGMVDMLNQAKAATQGLARATRALGTASDGAAAKAEPAFGAIGDSARTMAAALQEATTVADTSLAGLKTSLVGTAGAADTAAATVAGDAEASSAAVAASSERSAVALDGTAGSLMKYATGLAAVGFGVFEAIKGATKFQTEMTRLSTASGAAIAQVNAMKPAVLATASAVGESGTAMAEALYHPVSAGLDLKTSLMAVKYAAEEAQISGADLEDTTYALSSVMKAFNYSSKSAEPTMAQLNAIVGEGDMRFQDFNQSVKNWAPTAAQMGISVTSMGSGLAYLTDRGNSAEVAATRLTMGLSMMTTPSSQATKMLVGLGDASTDVKASSAAMQHVLQESGITQNHLAADLRKPDGLYVALNDLKKSLEKAGVSGTEADSVLSKIFGGGRSDKAVMALMQNLDGLKQKYDKIAHDSTTQNFQAAWEKTAHTVGFQFDQLKADFENLGIKLGTALMPALTKALGLIRTGVQWVTQHKAAVQALAAVLGGVVVTALWGVATALMAISASPVALTITAVAAAAIYAYTHFKGFRDAVNDIARFLKGTFVGAIHLARTVITDLVSWWAAHKQTFIDAWDTAVKDVQKVIKWFDTNVISWVKARVSELVAWWSDHSQEISQVWGVVWGAVKVEAQIVWDVIKVGLAVLSGVWKATWGIIRDTVKTVWAAVSGIVTTAIHGVENTIAVVLDLMTGHWSKAWSDAKKYVSQGLSDIKKTITSVTSNFGTLLLNAGKNVVHGLVSGIKSATGSVSSAMGSVAKEIRAHLPFSPAKKGPLSGSGSPDLAGRKIALMVADGLVQGVAASSGTVSSAMRGMAKDVMDPFAQALGIASPSKKFKTFGGWIVYGLIQGLTGSTANVKAATKRLATDLYADYHGHTGLRDYVNRENAELLKLAKQRDSVATRLKAATKNLKDLQADWTKEKTSVAQGIMQGMSAIAPDNADGRTLSSADVVANMQAQFQQASQFANQLKQLQKEGLSSSLIQQYAEAGVDQAGATVAALASGPQSAISQMNQYQKSLQAQANTVGTTVANSMYGAGISSAKGLVKGLQKQEKAIEAEMLKIAKSMQKAIEKALGIHSPSRVMAELGDYAAQGMALGINRSGKQAAIAAKGMAMLVRQSASLGPGMAGVDSGARGVGGTGPTNIYITIEGNAVTTNQLVDDIETAMLRKGMRRPVTYTNYKR